jgi:hypothetical protein
VNPRYYAELLKKGLVIKNANINYKIELFINILNNYEDIHLIVLKFAFEAPAKEYKDKKDYRPFQIIQEDLSVPSLHETISDNLISTYDLVIITLLSQGLIELGEQSKKFRGRPFGIYKISKLGTEFMEWIL